jgi:putative ABC transport system permease protein
MLHAAEAPAANHRLRGGSSRMRISSGRSEMFSSVLTDVRYGVRRLSATPGFLTVVVSTLALGIGASTAIFSAIAPILLEPLPYPQSNRLVMLTDRNVDGSPLNIAYGTHVELEARSRTFDAFAVTRRWQAALAGVGESERLAGAWVSANYFRVLGVMPAAGRNFIPSDFDADDAEAGGPQVAIVSDRLARRRLGGAPAALGSTLRLDDVPHTVIGVMPPWFENVLAPEAEIWAPLQYRQQAAFDSREWGHHLQMIGRLAPEVSIDEARHELGLIASISTQEFPRPRHASLENGLTVDALQSSITAAARPLLLGILGAVLLLLVIACANVTHLLIARGVERRGELAVRAALGADRPRLVRQLLTESALLAVLGGVLGLGIALAGIELIVALAPAGLPRIDAVRLDLPAFMFALAVTAVAGLTVGLAPALGSTRNGSRFGVHSGSRIAGGSHSVLRRGLVVTQVALALVLLAGAGLLLRSVERLLATPPGFDAANLVTMQIVATGRRFESADAVLQFFQSALGAVRALPGVIDASLTSQLPLSGYYEAYGVRFESATQQYANDGALRYTVTPEWFRAMKIPLLEGRLLDAGDRRGAQEAVLINESFARRRFGARSPIGERLRIGPDESSTDGSWRTVVGVVGDVKQTSLGLTPPDAFYVPLGQWAWVDIVQSLVVRTSGDPAALIPLVQQAIWSIDSVHPITRVATMESLLAASEAERRFALTVFALFAVAALVLAALGLYGMTAGGVAERTREIGLRAALGATPVEIGSLVVRHGMVLAGLGMLIGLAGAAVANRSLETLLYGVTPLDPVTYAAVIALLGGVSAAACWLPARRAARVDPVVALRAE